MSVEAAKKELAEARRHRDRVDNKIREKQKARREVLERLRSKRDRDPKDEKRQKELDREIESLAAEVGRYRDRIQKLTDKHEDLQDEVDKRARKLKAARKRRKERNEGGAKAAVKWARAQKGKHESPPGSNWGEPVQTWIRNAGYGGPVPWCFAPGTLINTTEGLLPIEEINVGDRVISAHGDEALVGAAHVREGIDRYRLKAHGIDQTIASGEHPYIARRRLSAEREYGDPEWVEVQDLQPGDLIAQPLLGGDEPMDSAKAYIIGRYLADGWGTRRKPRLGRRARVERFICGDHSERDEIADALDRAGLGYSEREYRTVVQFALRVDARDLLAECGNSAGEKRLPGRALSWNREAREALMQGYIDGDGCSYENTVRANSISRELTLGMAQIARGLGHIVTVRVDEREPVGTIEGRVVNQATERYTLTYRPEGIIEGKSQVVTGIDNHAWVPVRSVEHHDVGPVHNLTVSGEHTFVADGYAVHNCGCFAHEAVVENGAADVTVQLGYAPNITNAANAGTGGLKRVSPSEAKAGDIGSLWNGEHVVVLRGPVSGSTVPTVEGNTSAADGSQTNGGEVAIKTRNLSDFDVIARPAY